MRPIYETQEDLSREAKVAKRLGQVWECSMRKLQPRDAFDYAAMRGDEVVGFVEIKNRRNLMGQYSTYMISMTKLATAHSIFCATYVPCVLVVQWSDCMGWISLSHAEGVLKMGGRSDRNDPGDIEPVFHIDISKFKVL